MRSQVEVLLAAWGWWALKRGSGALGYPSVSPMFRDAPRGDSYGSAIPLGMANRDMEAVDMAVRRLPDELRKAVVEMYQRGGSLRAVAARIKISDKTLRKRLDEAYEKIALDMADQFPQNPANSDRVHWCAQQ